MKNKAHWKFVVGFSLTLAILSLNSTALAQERSKPAGTVIGMSGEWFLVGKPWQQIKKGQELPAGGRVRLVSREQGAKSSFIEVVLRDGKKVNFSCEMIKGCSWPIPGPIKEEMPLPDLFWKFLGIRAHKDDYVRTFTRGDDLEDGVVILNKGQADLSAVFWKMKPDLYLLRFQSVDNKGGLQSEPLTHHPVYDWEPGKPSPLSIGSIGQGLYQIEILDKDTTGHDPTGVKAWVLLAEPRHYEALQESFQKVVALTHKWEKGSKSDATRIFLRAYLNYLAAEKN